MPGAQVLAVDPTDRILFQRSRDTGRWELPAGAAEPGRRWTGELIAGPDEVVELGFFAEPPGELHPPTRVVLGLYAAYRASGVFQAR